MSEYERGFQAGYVAREQQALQQPRGPITSRHWALAAGTLVAGIGGASALVLGRSKSDWANVAVAGVFTAGVVAATFAALDVLTGAPTPRLRIKP